MHYFHAFCKSAATGAAAEGMGALGWFKDWRLRVNALNREQNHAENLIQGAPPLAVPVARQGGAAQDQGFC